MAKTKKTTQVKQFVYDVSGGDSGAIGAHTLGVLPKGAILSQAFFDIQTTFTSATDAATIAVGVTGATGAFDAAIAISNGGNPWDAGRRAADEPTNQTVIPAALSDFHAAAASTSVFVLATVAVEALTAGKFVLNVEYYIP
jgi:hypothetical protein